MQAQKFLKKVTPKHGKQIASKIVELQNDPEPHDAKHLKGEYPVYQRADVGEYRLIHRVDLARLCPICRQVSQGWELPGKRWADFMNVWSWT